MTEATDQSSIPNKDVLNKMVREHMVAAFAAGMVPVPFAGMAVMGAVQLHLLKKITESFGISFSKNTMRAILGALVGGAIPVMSGPFIAGVVKGIPVAGTVLGVISMPSLSAAMTYAIGHLFIEHFTSGGTLLTLDIESTKDRFANLFKKGAASAETMGNTDQAKPNQAEQDREPLNNNHEER